MIAAMDKNNLIGNKNTLPWRLPADMKWFVSNTLGKPVVMGRKTFESLGSKPLKNRQNIVVTRDSGFRAKGVDIAYSLDDVIALSSMVEEVMIIGGANFYQQFFPLAHRLYLTKVHGEFAGDSWFPDYNLADWQQSQCEHHSADENNPYDYSFYIFDRK